MQVSSVGTEIEEKITDQLPRSVLGGLPAAISLEERMRQMFRAAQARLVRVTADGVNRIMLEQPKFVGGVRIRALFLNEFVLLRQCLRETNSA